jgi:hypothetical protein
MLGLAAAGAIGTLFVVIANPLISTFDAGTGGRERMFAGLGRIGKVSPEFEAKQQGWLSSVSLGIAFAGWIGIYLSSPAHAIGVLAAVLLLGVVGSAVHRRKWLLGGEQISRR